MTIAIYAPEAGDSKRIQDFLISRGYYWLSSDPETGRIMLFGERWIILHMKKSDLKRLYKSDRHHNVDVAITEPSISMLKHYLTATERKEVCYDIA